MLGEDPGIEVAPSPLTPREVSYGDVRYDALRAS